MEFFPTSLSGVVRIQPKAYGDDRGYFSETWQEKKFAAAGIEAHFVQDNHSFSAEVGTLRGLHFQSPPFAQDKLVRVTRGRVLDVAVDLRRSSKTFGRHFEVQDASGHRKGWSGYSWDSALFPDPRDFLTELHEEDALALGRVRSQ